jgi:beta-lactamase class A
VGLLSEVSGTILAMDGVRSKRKRWVRFIFLVTSVVITVLLIRSFFRNRVTVISPIPDDMVIVQNTPKPKSFTLFKKQKSVDDLTEKINNTLGGKWSDYSIIVEDYTSDFALRISEGEIFVAASVNKVPILAALYYYANKGEVDLDRDITVQAADIQDYGTGSLRYDKPGAVYSVKTLAKLMIKQSDNTAAYILANHIVGFPKLKEVVATWGLSQTDMVANKTSNLDMAKMFRLIYDRKVTDEAHTLEMLSFLKDTDFETRLPADLPDGTTAYHKIGTEVGIIHDAGIVTDGKHTYYVGVFTSGTTEGEETDKLMATLSKTVYDYMKQ